jgi:putative CocE/NonD family hydrolase
MKKFLFYVALAFTYNIAIGQMDTIPIARYTTAMIPMRDGVKLFTIIFTPLDTTQPVPIMIYRSPYGSRPPIPKDSVVKLLRPPIPKDSVAKLSYRPRIIVWQDVRGRHKSEGIKLLHQPVIHATQKGAVDESTDTWDTIDWLIKNVHSNNGNVGLQGSSYPGWLALTGAIDPHPVLKAVIEHACMADLFLGDDFHHNGAFRLEYSFDYVYLMEKDSVFPYPQYDSYDWFLKLGSLKNVNEKFFHNSIPAWNDFVNHPNYDSFWQKNSPLNYMPYPQVPILHQGGYYDQEDLNGPQLMYSHLEKKDSFHRNFLVLGPWNHGAWNAKEDSLGKISFHARPLNDLSQQLEKKWWDYWLKGIGDGKFEEACCYQTGSNEWKTYDAWPPKNTVVQKLYAGPNNTCSFNKPKSNIGFVSYISDPNKPVPYRNPPIEAINSNGSRWWQWQVEDQRFVYSRPDVVSFMMDTLTEDLTVTGKIIAHLFASTTGTDADWIVKLIDVYPNFYQKNLLMSQYQLPVAMEVFRGRFRKSFSNPSPLIPNKPEEFVIDLHDINHVFKKGHCLMIQVQSTWFPLIDRNPQKFVPNIFEAKESDFIKATHKIYFSAQYPTYIELPVMSK